MLGKSSRSAALDRRPRPRRRRRSRRHVDERVLLVGAEARLVGRSRHDERHREPAGEVGLLVDAGHRAADRSPVGICTDQACRRRRRRSRSAACSRRRGSRRLAARGSIRRPRSEVDDRGRAVRIDAGDRLLVAVDAHVAEAGTGSRRRARGAPTHARATWGENPANCCALSTKSARMPRSTARSTDAFVDVAEDRDERRRARAR